MSAKIAVIIGDYSNGWSDAQIVQMVGNFSEKQCRGEHQREVTEIMSDACAKVVAAIERNEGICPKPKDEPCCDKFEAWAEGQDFPEKMKLCPFCGTVISVERGAKYFKQKGA
jgi:hypothetical protein